MSGSDEARDRGTLPFPEGEFTLWADDDDVIGLTVAKTWPSGMAIVRTDPPLMDACDEFDIGTFLAWCLTNHAETCAHRDFAAMVEEKAQRRVAHATKRMNEGGDADYWRGYMVAARSFLGLSDPEAS